MSNSGADPAPAVARRVTEMDKAEGGFCDIPLATLQESDGAAGNVEAALAKAIIPCLIVWRDGLGSVHVPERDRERALSIVEADARERRYWAVLCRELNSD